MCPLPRCHKWSPIPVGTPHNSLAKRTSLANDLPPIFCSGICLSNKITTAISDQSLCRQIQLMHTHILTLRDVYNAHGQSGCHVPQKPLLRLIPGQPACNGNPALKEVPDSSPGPPAAVGQPALQHPCQAAFWLWRGPIDLLEALFSVDAPVQGQTAHIEGCGQAGCSLLPFIPG